MADRLTEQKKQDDYLKSNLHNMVMSGMTRGRPRFSVFLDEHQKRLSEDILRHSHCDNFLFFGGTEGCERVMLGVFPSNIEPTSELFPITVLKLTPDLPKGRNAEKLSHRDYLGALMSLGVKRETTGDILVSDEGAILFATSEITEYLLQNLNRIGKFSVAPEKTDADDTMCQKEYQEICGTVASLRLDCVVAFVTGKSRGAVQSLVGAGMVRVNAVECTNASKLLREKDVLSIRGVGKFIFEEELKRTKKERYLIRINKMV